MYNYDDIVIREIGGGIWCIISLALTIAFVHYSARKTFWEFDRPVYVVYAVWALSLFFAGSTVRGALTWMQFLYERHGWDSSIWVKTWPWFATSLAFNIAGGTAAIWYLSDWRWRVAFTAVSAGLAVGVPISLFYLI